MAGDYVDMEPQYHQLLAWAARRPQHPVHSLFETIWLPAGARAGYRTAAFMMNRALVDGRMARFTMQGAARKLS